MAQPRAVSPEVADWIETRLDRTSVGSIARVVPRGFDHVLRVLHPAGDGRTWAEVAEANGTTVHRFAEWFSVSRRTGLGRSSDLDPEEGSVPASALAAILDHCPGTGEIYCAVWEGFGSWSDEPHPESTARGYYVFATPRAPFLSWPGMDPLWPQSANMIWPPDQSWFIATDIDRDSTLVAGPDGLAEALMADTRLEAFEMSYDDKLTIWSDNINAPPPYLEPQRRRETS